MMKMSAKRSRKVLTVSQASKDDILHYLGVPADKVEVIYNALDERLRSCRPRKRSIACGSVSC
jgi:hypothetical protein